MHRFELRLRCVAKTSLGILAVAALFGVSAADDGAANNYEEYARHCRNNGGTPYPWDGNRPLRCEFSSDNSTNSGPGGSSPASDNRIELPPDPVQIAQARYVEMLGRYSAALRRLQSVVGGLQAVAGAVPQSLEEISARLSVIYAGAAYRLDSIAAARNHSADVLADASGDTRWQTERLQMLEKQMATAATRKSGSIAQLGALKKEQRQLALLKSSLDLHRVQLAKAAHATTGRVVQWLWIAGVPKAQRPETPFARQRTAVDDHLPAWQYPNPTSIPAFIVPDMPRLPELSRRNVKFRAPLGGTVDEKLIAVENLVPQIESAASAFAAESQQAASAEAHANATANALRATTQLYRDVEGEAYNVKVRVGIAANTLDLTRKDCRTSALNMLREAIVVTVLNRVEPGAMAAVKEFITINSDARQIAALTNEKVASLYKAGQVALRLPVGTQFKGMDKFLETQRTVLALMKNPLQSAVDGANAMGNANPNVGMAEARAVFRGLHRDALEIVEAASESLPGGARDIATRLLNEEMGSE